MAAGLQDAVVLAGNQDLASSRRAGFEVPRRQHAQPQVIVAARKAGGFDLLERSLGWLSGYSARSARRLPSRSRRVWPALDADRGAAAEQKPVPVVAEQYVFGMRRNVDRRPSARQRAATRRRCASSTVRAGRARQALSKPDSRCLLAAAGCRRPVRQFAPVRAHRDSRSAPGRIAHPWYSVRSR